MSTLEEFKKESKKGKEMKKFKSLKIGQKFECGNADFMKTGTVENLVNAVCLAPAGKDEAGIEIGIADYVKFDGPENVEIIQYKKIK